MRTKQSRKEKLSIVAELVLQPYIVDPGSLELLVEEAVSVQVDGPTRIACDLLAKENLSPMEWENLGQFVRHAASRDSVRQSFAKSMKPGGRCPKAKRDWLQRWVNPLIEAPRGLRTKPPSGPSEFLDLSDIAGALGEFPEIMNRIGDVSLGAREINIKLGGFTYAATLAVLAQWILANSFVGKYDFIESSDNTLRYLDDIRFDSALRNPEIVISPDIMDWAVGLTRINRDQPTHKVANKIVDILETFMDPNREDRDALLVLISEMIENVHRHAKSPVDGFAVAQVYPKRLKMGVTLVDAGMGIRGSFEEGNPSVSIEGLSEDAEFLREAVRLYSTSKDKGHSGYGLYLLTELVARNGGTFLLTSGEASMMGYMSKNEIRFDTYKHKPWSGTIVSVIIDLNRDLPLNEIYNEMPLPEGIEEDDLFV